MMKRIFSLAIVVVMTTGIFAQAAPQAGAKPSVHAAKPVNEGQRIFEENCSRCHNVPNGFSPRISGTILRHMRVRASLSEHDEKALLRFFNP